MKSHFGWLEHIFGGRGNSLLHHLLLYQPCQMIFHSKFGFTVIKCAVSCNASPVLLLHDIMCSVTGRFFSPIFQKYVPILSQLVLNIHTSISLPTINFVLVLGLLALNDLITLEKLLSTWASALQSICYQQQCNNIIQQQQEKGRDTSCRRELWFIKALLNVHHVYLWTISYLFVKK